MKVYLNHTGHLLAVHVITNVMQCSDSSVCMPGCCYYYYARCLCFCAPAYIFFIFFYFFVLKGLCVRWLQLLKEVLQVQLCCVLANVDQSYEHNLPSSTPLW